MPSTIYNPDGSRTGLRINAAVRRKRAFSSGNQGPISTRPTSTEAWEMHERNRARADAAAAVPAPPSAPAAAAAKPAAAKPAAAKPAEPAKPKGQLVQGPGGSAVWKSGEQLAEDAQLRERAAARRRAGTPGTAEFAGPMPSVEMQQAKRAKDRAYARWRVQSEAYIQDPEWGKGSDPEEAARHRAFLMKTMAEEKTKNEFMDYPPWYGKNVPSKTPQTAREWDEVGRKPLY